MSSFVFLVLRGTTFICLFVCYFCSDGQESVPLFQALESLSLSNNKINEVRINVYFVPL